MTPWGRYHPELGDRPVLVALTGFGTNVSRDEEAIAVLVLGGAAVLAALWRAGLVLRRGFRRR